jgi:MFS family permease
VIPRLKDRLTGRRVLGVSGACYGLAACLFTATTFVPVAYVGAFIWGITGAVFGTVTITSLQQASPQRAHGRIMGVTTAIGAWVETLGLPLGGVTLAALGIRAGAVALAGVAILAGLTCLTIAAMNPAPSLGDPPPDRGKADS